MFGRAVATFIMLICLVGCGGGGSSDGPPKVLGLTSRASGTTAELNSVAVGNGKYVAVGDGTILVSSDSVSWTPKNYNNYLLKGIVHGNNLFVAVGYTKEVYPNKVLLTSQDGINWEQRLSPQRGELLAIVFDGSKFIVTGDRSRLLVSVDGITWTETAITHSELVRMNGIAYGGGHYVAVGNSGGLISIYRSSDGVTWEWVPTYGHVGDFSCVAYGAGYFVAVKNNATKIYYSTDGANWGVVSYAEWTGKGVAFTGSEFIIVGAPSSYDSTNLCTFMPVLNLERKVAISGSSTLNEILYSDNRIVIVGRDGLIASN